MEKCNFRFRQAGIDGLFCMIKYKRKYNESPECDYEDCIFQKILKNKQRKNIMKSKMKIGYTCPYCSSMIDKDKFEHHKKYCLYRTKKYKGKIQ